jgi:hypothetical protein
LLDAYHHFLQRPVVCN